ncbi:MAG: hypothetical protein RJA52_308 [Bacteroidota bacterium]
MDSNKITTLYAFFILIFIVFIGLLLGNWFSLLLANSLDINPAIIVLEADENCDPLTRNYLRSMNLFNHLFGFVLATLIASYIIHKKQFLAELAIQKNAFASGILTALLMIILAFPGAQILYKWNQSIPLPPWMTSAEEETENLLNCILQMDNPMELLFNFFIIAIIPALGEELLFRGFLQKKLQQLIAPVFAILITSIIFSAFHFQFEGFLPRFLLGAILGFSFFITGNLWVSIIAHLFFNGIQVLAYYFVGDIAQDPSVEVPILLGIFSLVTVIIAGFFWWKRMKNEN